MLVEAELPALRERLSGSRDLVLYGVCCLDGSSKVHTVAFGSQEFRGALTFSQLDELLTAGYVDLVVISDQRGPIRRETACALIDLVLRGGTVLSLSQFLAAPELVAGLVPHPEIVGHLLARLDEDSRGRRVKRVLDVVLGSLGLLAAAPLCLLIALAIRLDSPGPVFFIQERLGRLRMPFSCIKFRTMYEDAERLTGPVWASDGDSRITRVGRILRKSRLDELPQLVNVVRGEMSLVGARPIRRHFADQLAAQVPFYDLRFLEKPGLTGWAQVKYRYSASFAEQIEKFQYDYYYIRNRSIALDLYIMLLTVWVMARMKGA